MGKIIATVVAVLVVVLGGAWLVFGLAGSSSNSDTASTTSLASLGLASTTPTTTSSTTATTGATSGATNQTNLANVMQATLHTNMGDITIEFFPQQAPNTVANFIKLASTGFYDGTKFHRVIKGFMDQGGDPLTKDDSKMSLWGTGGPGYQFNDEITSGNSNVAGSIAMANSGPNTQGSQFFINAVNNPSLNSGYTVFGKVTAGMDVVTAINNTPVDSSDRPITPVVLTSITLK
jgi:cyclophilin family peptidyl-prolyl cis-trans isomerase